MDGPVVSEGYFDGSVRSQKVAAFHRRLLVAADGGPVGGLFDRVRNDPAEGRILLAIRPEKQRTTVSKPAVTFFVAATRSCSIAIALSACTLPTGDAEGGVETEGVAVGGTQDGSTGSSGSADSGSSGAVDGSSGPASDDGPGIFDVGGVDGSGDPGCDPEAIPDTLAFTLERTIEVGVSTLQAAYYDTVRDEVTVLSFGGEGRVLDSSGNILREVFAPPEALPRLDGGAYDAARDVVLLIRQDCTLVEVDPATMTAMESFALAEVHGISICAGIAIARNGNRYIASYGTDELVVVTPLDHALVFRRDLAAMSFTGIDGIAEIAGSDNFLVNSTIQAEAMIIDDDGQIVVAPGAFGGVPLSGATDVDTLDSMVTICDNGHTWLCDEYSTTCWDFAPSDGDKQACECLVAG